MKKVYGLISRIVHEGQRFIGSNSVRHAEELALVSIYKVLELYVELSEGKYEIDWKSGVLRLKRFLHLVMKN